MKKRTWYGIMGAVAMGLAIFLGVYLPTIGNTPTPEPLPNDDDYPRHWPKINIPTSYSLKYHID